MVSKKIFIIVFLNCFLIGNNDIFNPVIKSAIIPGWGELSLGNKKRSRVFFIIEAGLLVSGFGSYIFSKNQIKNYQSFSANHAGINIKDKNHKYWVDIGNYDSYLDYNEEHLRFREPDDLYYFADQWSWDSKINRENFKKMRINADLLTRQMNFIFGALFINRIISSIDVLYLKRLKTNPTFTIIPSLQDKELYYELKINFY